MLRIVLVTTAVLLLQSVASARTHTVRYNGRLIVINNPTIVQPAPRIEKPDHWDTLRADYFKRTYGGRGYCR